jgi:Lon protease-like protein
MSEIKSWLRRNLPLLFDTDNAMESLEIPIFPLNAVIFPGGLLPLRVFEQRYMDMVKGCMRDDQPFGICLIKEGEEVGAPAVPEEVGCLVRISSWDMPQLGVLSIQALGVRRFSILKYKPMDSGLIMATVQTISTEAPAPIPTALQPCAEVLRRIIEQLGEDKFQPPLQYDDAVWVGYRLAEVLPIKNSAKQSMLEMNDSIARLEILQRFLQQQGLV